MLGAMVAADVKRDDEVSIGAAKTSTEEDDDDDTSGLFAAMSAVGGAAIALQHDEHVEQKDFISSFDFFSFLKHPGEVQLVYFS